MSPIELINASPVPTMALLIASGALLFDEMFAKFRCLQKYLSRNKQKEEERKCHITGESYASYFSNCILKNVNLFVLWLSVAWAFLSYLSMFKDGRAYQAVSAFDILVTLVFMLLFFRAVVRWHNEP